MITAFLDILRTIILQDLEIDLIAETFQAFVGSVRSEHSRGSCVSRDFDCSNCSDSFVRYSMCYCASCCSGRPCDPEAVHTHHTLVRSPDNV